VGVLFDINGGQSLGSRLLPFSFTFNRCPSTSVMMINDAAKLSRRIENVFQSVRNSKLVGALLGAQQNKCQLSDCG